MGIRVRHPDHDFHDSSAKHLRSLVVIGGRSWGTFVAQELRTSSLPMLTSIFEFTSDHRSLVRRCDAISSAASQMTSTSDTISMRRQVHDEALRLLSDSLNGLNALADVSTTAQYRKKLFNSIKGLGESFEVSLSLYFYEDIFLQWWELTQDGEWEKIKGSHLESIDALQARPLMKLFDASNAKSVIVERIRSGFGFKGLMLLSAEPLKALSSILSGEWDGNFAALLLSISAILSSQAALHSNVMFGTAPISSSSFFPNPFLPLSSADLESDLSVDCALMGSSLLHSFTDAFYPTFRLLPLYLSSESSIDIINTTALPPQLCSGLRSAHHRAISNSTSASSSALHLLENSEAYMAYFHKVVGRSETNTVNCERVYLFTNGSFQNIASDNDSVVVLVLICATFLIHPSFLTTLDRYIFERLLPFIYLNRCSTPLAQELRRHPFKVVPESSQATTDAIPKEVIETPLTYVENNAKLDTRDDVLETISAKLSFHSTLLRSLFGMPRMKFNIGNLQPTFTFLL